VKVAIINNKIDLETGGGSHIQVHLIASELASLNCDVSVLTFEPSLNSYPDNLPYSIIEEDYKLPNIFDRRKMFTLYKLMRRYENQFDIYHLFNTSHLLGGGLYRFLGGKLPVIANLQGYHFCRDLSRLNMDCCRRCGIWQKFTHTDENLARKVILAPIRVLADALEIMLANRIDVFAPIFTDMGRAYAWQHLDMGKMTVVPVPVDYEYMCQLSESHQSKLTTDKVYNILYAGRLSHEKGVDILINAVSKLDFNVCLHIAGDGWDREKLESLTRELGISGRVIFHGWIHHDKLAELILDSDLIVHPARWPEVFCLSVVEAMALRKPIIISDYGGVERDLDGAALTFNHLNVDDLVEKIKLVYGNPSLADSLAGKAQEKAKEFDYKKLARCYLDIYRILAGKHQRIKSNITC
jgi:glycosyltransferase involved in cell wall biosynthesis